MDPAYFVPLNLDFERCDQKQVIEKMCFSLSNR